LDHLICQLAHTFGEPSAVSDDYNTDHGFSSIALNMLRTASCTAETTRSIPANRGHSFTAETQRAQGFRVLPQASRFSDGVNEFATEGRNVGYHASPD
jgi:hypothetical protein